MAPSIRTTNEDGQRLVWFDDPSSQLSGVVAIDSLALGPAAGGCRFWHYEDTASMVTDARRLARGMSYKNAMADLPFGGGKSVIQRPPGDFDRVALFRSFGQVLNELAGDYLAAEDVGTSPHDMAAIRSVSPHVFGLPPDGDAAGGDPSPWTALGVYLSIETVLIQRGLALGQSRVAVQGLGNVGADLCRRLHASGVALVVSDIDDSKIERLLADVPSDVVPSDSIHASQVDLFAPCALGGGLNENSIPEIRASFVVGAANNQLATLVDDERLHGRGIIYAPDYVVNAGGIINVAAEVLGHSRQDVLDHVRRIPNRLAKVLAHAEATGQAPSRVADQLAREIIEHSAAAESSVGAR